MSKLRTEHGPVTVKCQPWKVHFIYCFVNASRGSRRVFLKKISLQNSSHSPWSRAPSALSGFPSTSTHTQTLHNSLQLSLIRLLNKNVKVSWLRVEKKHTRCLLTAAVADLAVPMVHTTTGSCITYRFTSGEVWCMEIWFDRSQNCLVEGCGSWKLEAGFLPLPTFFFFKLVQSRE